MKIINLTSHDVNVYDCSGNIIKVYKPSGLVARVAYSLQSVDCVDGIPINVQKNTRVVELPEPIEGVMFIVSSYLYNYCVDRTDLLALADKVKVNGKDVGCRSFLKRG